MFLSYSMNFKIDMVMLTNYCKHFLLVILFRFIKTNALKVEVERLSAASPPITGTFTLTFEGQESVGMLMYEGDKIFNASFLCLLS